MQLTDSDLLHIIKNPLSLQGKYANRLIGAMAPLMNNVDYSLGAYFWNATSQQYKSDPGFNWRQYNKGTYVITVEYGNSTFFKYADGRKWP